MLFRSEELQHDYGLSIPGCPIGVDFGVDDDNKKQAVAEVVIASMLAAALAENKLPLNMIWVCAAGGSCSL